MRSFNYKSLKLLVKVNEYLPFHYIFVKANYKY